MKLLIDILPYDGQLWRRQLRRLQLCRNALVRTSPTANTLGILAFLIHPHRYPQRDPVQSFTNSVFLFCISIPTLIWGFRDIITQKNRRYNFTAGFQFVNSVIEPIILFGSQNTAFYLAQNCCLRNSSYSRFLRFPKAMQIAIGVDCFHFIAITDCETYFGLLI